MDIINIIWAAVAFVADVIERRTLLYGMLSDVNVWASILVTITAVALAYYKFKSEDDRRGTTAKATVVGKDTEGHTQNVQATGVNIPAESNLYDKMGNTDVEVNVTGIKKGSADTVVATGFNFQPDHPDKA